MKKNRSWAILVLLVLFTASAAAAMGYGRIGYRFAADGSAVLLFLAIAEGLLDKRQDALADLSPWQRWYLLLMAVSAILLIGVMGVVPVDSIWILYRLLLLLLLFQMGIAAYGEALVHQRAGAGRWIYALFLLLVLSFQFKAYRDLDRFQYLEPIAQARQIPYLQAEAAASVFGAMMFWMAQQILFLQTKKAEPDGRVQLWRRAYRAGMFVQPVMVVLAFLEAAMRTKAVGWAIFIAVDACFCLWLDQKAGPRVQQIRQ